MSVCNRTWHRRESEQNETKRSGNWVTKINFIDFLPLSARNSHAMWHSFPSLRHELSVVQMVITSWFRRLDRRRPYSSNFFALSWLDYRSVEWKIYLFIRRLAFWLSSTTRSERSLCKYEGKGSTFSVARLFFLPSPIVALADFWRILSQCFLFRPHNLHGAFWSYPHIYISFRRNLRNSNVHGSINLHKLLHCVRVGWGLAGNSQLYPCQCCCCEVEAKNHFYVAPRLTTMIVYNSHYELPGR